MVARATSWVYHRAPPNPQLPAAAATPMHQPTLQPRPSIYYRYQVHEVARPPAAPREVQALLRQMVEHGEVDHLVPERVWQELSRGLMEDHPARLLEVLREDLDLTGTKHGCELGECGTCAVLVDGHDVEAVHRALAGMHGLVIGNDDLHEVAGLDRYVLMSEPYLLLMPSALTAEHGDPSLTQLARNYPMICYNPHSFLGAQIAQNATLEEWKDRPAQQEVPRAELVQHLVTARPAYLRGHPLGNTVATTTADRYNPASDTAWSTDSPERVESARSASPSATWRRSPSRT